VALLHVNIITKETDPDLHKRPVEKLMKYRVLTCGLLLAMSGLAGSAGEKISMKATPEISFAPAHLTVRTTIEPDPQNRAVEIVIDSQDFYRSTLTQLEGDQAPRVSVVEFKGIPGGVYEISARLLGEDGKPIAYARRMIDVIVSDR
jgi:hypothetical protein